MKTASNHLRFPITEELVNSEIFITENEIQILKFHGSYQQDNRDLRAAGQQKHYQFTLRLNMPSGEFQAPLYQVIDDMSSKYGNNTIRATTRCTWQIHGILKADLKYVFASIMNAGGSCVGACGDWSRNVMSTPAPFHGELYHHARFDYTFVGELFDPQRVSGRVLPCNVGEDSHIRSWALQHLKNTVMELHESVREYLSAQMVSTYGSS